MRARIPNSKDIRDEFNDYVKRNFNLYAERIFQCWAMAMNDAGYDSDNISDTAKKAYKLMTEIAERRISWKDMHDVIKDEIGIEFVFNNIKFTPVDSKRVLDIIERYKDGYCSANECIEEIEREVKNNTEPKVKPKPEISAEAIAKEISKVITPKIKEQIESEVKKNG